MAAKETDKYRAAKSFHNHAEEYDSWFEDSLVYEIEVTALKSLHAQMDDPKMEIGVGLVVLPGTLGLVSVLTQPGLRSHWLPKG